MSSSQRAAGLVEFALAWPVAVLLVTGAVQIALWGAEWSAAHSAAEAGARAASMAGASPEEGAVVAARSLGPAVAGAGVGVWCPGNAGPTPPVWVCARDLGNAVEVSVGGAAPALVPLPALHGLPLRAHVTVAKESFAP